MYVGSLQVRLLIREARSLKDKRQVVSGVKDRLRQRYNVSVAEIDAQDHRQLAVLGVAAVSGQAGHVRTVLQQVVEYLRRHPVAELLDYDLDAG